MISKKFQSFLQIFLVNFERFCFDFSEIKFSNKYGNESQSETMQPTWAAQYSFPSTDAKKIYLNQILAAVPSYDESLPVHSTNEHCARHSKFVLQSANHLELWALKSKFSFYSSYNKF